MAKRVYDLREKRKQQRFPIALPSTIESDDNHTPVMSLVSRDVCAGGGYYPTDSPLPIGTQVLVKMIATLGGAEGGDAARTQISIPGNVVRADATGMAVCFTKRYKITSMAE
jgi:hypothetical protein